LESKKNLLGGFFCLLEFYYSNAERYWNAMRYWNELLERGALLEHVVLLERVIRTRCVIGMNYWNAMRYWDFIIPMFCLDGVDFGELVICNHE